MIRDGRAFRLVRSPLLHVGIDALLLGAGFYLSLYLRLGPSDFIKVSPHTHFLVLGLVTIKLAVLTLSGVYRIIWRYFSLNDLILLGRGLFFASVASVAAIFFLSVGIPRGTFIFDAILACLTLGGARILRRMVYELPNRYETSRNGKRTVIYGAGWKGKNLLNRFTVERIGSNHVIGFVDDTPRKQGGLVNGVPVLGNGNDLKKILSDHRVEELYVAISDPKGRHLREILATCYSLKVKVRILQPVSNTSGTQAPPLRPLELSDLLGRGRRDLDLNSVRNLIEGRRVIVTGAGGSIGSELVKQIHSYAPEKLVLLDHSELNLYQIDRQVRKNANSQTSLVTCLADIKDRRTLQQVFKEHRPQIVFHAAAYKHVHLAEASPYSTILNNVLGTRHLLELSQLSQSVEAFVLISTDKAVSPGGVMGATKRVCELMTTQAGLASGKRFVSVRFGNVLGSSGSLIPLLKEQIQNNDPVTITHPEMRRYFMLVPEAVSLVLRASSMAKSGDIMVLKMGDPLKIVELAKSLIALMGKKEEQVPIVFTGLRPGEKLSEDLYLSGDELSTADPDILLLPRGDAAFSGNGVSVELLTEAINKLISFSIDGNVEAFEWLESIVGNKLKHRPQPSDYSRPMVQIPNLVQHRTETIPN